MRLLPISLFTLSLLVPFPLVAQSKSGDLSTASQIERQSLAPNANADTRALTDLQFKFEEATIRGDVAFVLSVEDPTMTMVHGDRWTNGGRPQLADDRDAYNQRVATQAYYVHDLDPTTLRYELHGDLAICYGRYVSVVNKPNGSNAAGKMTSIWFERVFRKLPDGRWVYLSHRTVHGPYNSPAGIDPTRVAWTATAAEQAAVPASVPEAYALPPATGANAGVPVEKDPTASTSPGATEVIAFQTAIAEAMKRGDSAFLQKAIAQDFLVVNSDLWIRGGRVSHAGGKEELLRDAISTRYKSLSDDHVHVEMHGDVAISYGRSLGSTGSASIKPGREWFSDWYERVYKKRDGQWQLVSHRTVSGPTFEPTRDSLGGK